MRGIPEATARFTFACLIISGDTPMKGRCSITGQYLSLTSNVCQRFVNFENVSMALQKCEKIDSIGTCFIHMDWFFALTS